MNIYYFMPFSIIITKIVPLFFLLQSAQLRKLRQCRRFTTIADKSPINYSKSFERCSSVSCTRKASSSSSSSSDSDDDDGQCRYFIFAFFTLSVLLKFFLFKNWFLWRKILFREYTSSFTITIISARKNVFLNLI